ncbi:MAG: hypothetical protein HYZ34_12820 [Ignavibacteriae bacterium]|nr:hypothetical protein [Ignavibacteriota bacterium]
MFEEEERHVIAVSQNWFINWTDGIRFKSVRPNIPAGSLSRYGSQYVFRDRSGEWWALTNEGLYRFSRTKSYEEVFAQTPQEIYTREDGLVSNNLSRLYEDDEGNIWISTRTGDPKDCGVARWNRSTGKIRQFSEMDGLPQRISPFSFAEDSGKNLWLGFYQGGIARFRNGRFQFFDTSNGVVPGMITDLYTDHAGRLWLSSNQRGLCVLESPNEEIPRFRYYTMKEGLGSNNVRCITEDEWGRIYIGTLRGVDRLEPATGQVRHYTQADGLANEYVTVAIRDKANQLWFGTAQGVSRLIPKLEEQYRAPPIYISGIRIAGTQYPVSEVGEIELVDVELFPGQNNIHIEFFSIGYGMGEVLRYQYKLVGADHDWSQLTKQRGVNYASLTPGNYEFLVRAVNAGGIFSRIPARLSFTILPPFWQQWWFYAVVIILVSAVLYSIYRLRLQKFVEMERLRLRIATDLHDDLGSALTRIAVHSETIQSTSSEEKIQTSAQAIGIVSREVIRTFSDIVWSIDIRHDTFGDMTSRMKTFALDILTPKDIAVHFSTNGLDPMRKIPVDLRQNLYLIFKEAINNIAKHSEANDVRIVLEQTGNRMRLTVNDNGRGLPEKVSHSHHGLNNMLLRSKRIGANFDISNNQGTQIFVELKLS